MECRRSSQVVGSRRSLAKTWGFMIVLSQSRKWARVARHGEDLDGLHSNQFFLIITCSMWHL